MKITRIQPGVRYSRIVIHGDVAYIAGHVAPNPTGKSLAQQTGDVLALLDEALAKAGSDKSHLLSVTIYLSDISGFDEMNGVYDTWVDKANMPTRVTVEAKIANPAEKIEVSAIAAVAR